MRYIFVKLESLLLPALLNFGFVLLPLVFWPQAYIPYEIPKVWFVERWIQLLLVIGFTSLLIFKRKQQTDQKIIIFTIAFSLIALLSSLVGSDLRKSIGGNYYRLDGLTTLFHLTSFSILLSLIWRQSWKRSIALAIVAGSTLTGMLSLIDGFKLYILHDTSLSGWQGAIGSTFGQPKFLTGYLLVTLPFAWYLAKKTSGYLRVLIYLAMAIQIGALFLTKSWAGVLIFLFLLFAFFWEKSFKYRKALVIGALLLFFFASTLFVFTKQQKRNILQFQGKIVAEGRERIIRKLLLSVEKRPLLGWGWANVDYAFKASDWPIKFERDIYLDKAHSHFLEVLTTTGIIGLVSYVLLITFVIKRLLIDIKNRKSDVIWFKTLLVSFIVFIVHSQTNVISIGEEVMFWIIAGVAATHS
ncbi:O-antigen ligase family protein [Candidatus Roizmanbacteria bacterium]|nr:O-antigen ligase family protein [Candidatus Roizmanbacteria bacterium]